ncbi:MAG: hypothetical protein RL745_318, partial [Actinomycetota bacterium]
MFTASESSPPGYASPLGARVHGAGVNVAVRVPKQATDVIVSIREQDGQTWRH